MNDPSVRFNWKIMPGCSTRQALKAIKDYRGNVTADWSRSTWRQWAWEVISRKLPKFNWNWRHTNAISCIRTRSTRKLQTVANSTRDILNFNSFHFFSSLFVRSFYCYYTISRDLLWSFWSFSLFPVKINRTDMAFSRYLCTVFSPPLPDSDHPELHETWLFSLIDITLCLLHSSERQSLPRAIYFLCLGIEKFSFYAVEIGILSNWT